MSRFVPYEELGTEAHELILLMELPEYIEGYTIMRLGLNKKAIPEGLEGDAKRAWLLGWKDSSADYQKGVNKMDGML
jgi:hypothetical protein